MTGIPAGSVASVASEGTAACFVEELTTVIDEVMLSEYNDDKEEELVRSRSATKLCSTIVGTTVEECNGAGVSLVRARAVDRPEVIGDTGRVRERGRERADDRPEVIEGTYRGRVDENDESHLRKSAAEAGTTVSVVDGRAIWIGDETIEEGT